MDHMSVFAETTEPVDVNTIIGENGKYRTPEDAAKAIIAKEEYIKRLEGENQEFRSEVDKRLSVEEQLAKFRNELGTERTPSYVPQEPVQVETTKGISEEDLVARIREVTQSLGREQKATSNAEQVANRLIETFGSEEKANAAVKAKATELGVSVKFLQDAASQSPTGFYNLIRLDAAPTSQAPMTRSDVNTANFGGAPRVQEGTKSYYDQMRRENPKAWMSPRIQQQMFKDAKAKGDAFYT
jgi:hypothetical protein